LLGKSYLKLAKPCPAELGGRRLPTAAIVPHSRRHRIQQSANILGDCCMHQHREWGIIAAVIGHLGHDASTDIVGWLWVVLYVGIRRLLYQATGDTLLTR
jgi:hypothetical protein